MDLIIDIRNDTSIRGLSLTREVGREGQPHQARYRSGSAREQRGGRIVPPGARSLVTAVVIVSRGRIIAGGVPCSDVKTLSTLCYGCEGFE